MSKTKRFAAFCDESRINWPLVRIPSSIDNQQDDSQYLSVYRQEIMILRAVFESISPCIIIQRCFRGYLSRRYLRRLAIQLMEEIPTISVNPEEEIKANRNRQLHEVLSSRGKVHLLQSRKKYQRDQRIKEFVRSYVHRFRAKKALQLAARTILKAFRAWHGYIHSAFHAFFRPTSKRQQVYQLYFLTDQLGLFKEILSRTILPANSFLTSTNTSAASTASKAKIEPIMPADRISCIRLHEDKPHWFLSNLPMLTVLKPSLSAKVIISDTKTVQVSSVFLARFRRAVTVTSVDKQIELLDQNGRSKFHFTREKILYFHKNKYALLSSCTFADKQSAREFMKQYVLSRLHNHPLNLTSSSPLSQKLVFLFSPTQLLRVSSVLKIQKWFRLIRQKPHLIDVMREIQVLRAVNKIQHWIRNMRWEHSKSLRRVLQGYMCSIISSTVYIPFDLYIMLRHICAATQHEMSLFTLVESQDIEVTFTQKQLFVGYKQHVRRPSMAQLGCKHGWLFGQARREGDMQESEERFYGDAMHILHVGSTAGICAAAGGLKYLRLTFADVSEAKRRAAILVLFTYRFTQNGSFVRMYNVQQIGQRQYMLGQIARTSMVYNTQFNWDDKAHGQVERSIGDGKQVFISSQDRLSQLAIAPCVVIAPAVQLEMYQEQQVLTSHSTSQVKIRKLFGEITVMQCQGLLKLNEEIDQKVDRYDLGEEVRKEGEKSVLTEDSMSMMTSIMSKRKWGRSSQYLSSRLQSVNRSQIRNSSELHVSMTSRGNQSSSDVIKILREREEKIVNEKAMQINQKRQSHKLVVEMNAVLKTQNIHERRNLSVREKRSRTLQHSLDKPNEIAAIREKVAVVKRIGQQESHEDKEWMQSFSRSSNSLIKQIHSFNTRQTLSKLEQMKASKVQETKARSINLSRSTIKSVIVGATPAGAAASVITSRTEKLPTESSQVIHNQIVASQQLSFPVSGSVNGGSSARVIQTTPSTRRLPQIMGRSSMRVATTEQDVSPSSALLLSRQPLLTDYTNRGNEEVPTEKSSDSLIQRSREYLGGNQREFTKLNLKSQGVKKTPAYAVFAEELFPLAKRSMQQQIKF